MRVGGAGPQQHVPTSNVSGGSSNNTSANATNSNGKTPPRSRNGKVYPPVHKQSRSPEPSTESGGKNFSSPSRRREVLQEGIELSREPWRNGSVEGGEAEELGGKVASGSGVQNMGAGNFKPKVVDDMGTGSSGYEVVEREEPLLGNDAGGEPGTSRSRDSLSAGLLWNESGSSLRSGGDASLGPAFTGHGRSGGAVVGAPSDDPAWFAEDSMVVGPDEGRWTVSGRPLVYLCAMCSSLCSVLLGYDVGVMSGAKEYIRPNLGLSTVQNEVMVGSLNIVAAFGGLLAGKAADRLGRKPTTALACVVFIVGATMMSMSHSYGFLLFGRVVTGVGVGCAMVIAPVYITELAPPDVRGMLVSLTDICINVGIVLGYAASLLCSNVFHTDSAKWRSMIGIGMLPPALILACLAMMPESPRWLIVKGRHADALDVLRRVLGDDKEAEDTLNTIRQSGSNQEEATWRDVLLPRGQVVKAAVWLGVGLGFWQQASGSEAAVYYTPEVLRNKGWNDEAILKGNMGVGGFKLLGEVVAFLLLDRIGRRPLFLASSVLVTLSLVLVGTSFLYNWTSLMTLFWLCMFMFTFSLGLGPVTFVVASEVLPVAIRGKAMSVVVCINRLMSGIIALSYQSMSDAMSIAGSFYFFGMLSALSIAFYYFCVPETRGKTLEEITADLGSAAPPSLPGPRGPANGSGSAGPRHIPLSNTDDDIE